MGIEALLARLEAAAGVTSVTPPAEAGVTRRAASTLACTPVTAVTSRAGDFGAHAANDELAPDAQCEAYEERAAILEHDAGLPREEAEAEARAMVYGPTPEQQAEGQQLAELARRPRGAGGLGWRDCDVAEYLDDDLRKQPQWAIDALRECLAHEAAGQCGHPDAAAFYGHLMLQPGRSAPLADCAALRALVAAGLARIEGVRATAVIPELTTLGSADACGPTHHF